MATNSVNSHPNGINGVSPNLEDYSIPRETQKLFEVGIPNNPLIASALPSGIAKAASIVRFEGTSKPSIPINWRFAESISALKGLKEALINVLLRQKYDVEPQEAFIDT